MSSPIFSQPTPRSGDATAGKRPVSTETPIFGELSRETFDTANPSPYADGAQRGVNEDLICRMSADKGEPDWMLAMRLKSLKIFREKPMPTWGADLSKLDLENIIYYVQSGAENTNDWGEVPEEIRKVYDRLGIPEAERKVLAGVGAQY